MTTTYASCIHADIDATKPRLGLGQQPLNIALLSHVDLDCGSVEIGYGLARLADFGSLLGSLDVDVGADQHGCSARSQRQGDLAANAAAWESEKYGV